MSSKPLYLSYEELCAEFPDEAACRRWFEQALWQSETPPCHKCKKTTALTARQGARAGWYICGYCKNEFSVRQGTALARGRVSFKTLLHCLYFLVTERNGISSRNLAGKLGIPQVTAWRLTRKLIFTCKLDDLQPLFFKVEADIGFIPTLQPNPNNHKTSRGEVLYNGKQTKTPVLGMIQRAGQGVAISIADRTKLTVHELIYNHIKLFETASPVSLYLDREQGFINLHNYERKYLNHSTGEFSRTEISYTKKGKKVVDKISTQTLDNYWRILKGGIRVVYTHITHKYLQSYLNEFMFRMTDAKMKRPVLDRMMLLARNLAAVPA